MPCWVGIQQLPVLLSKQILPRAKSFFCEKGAYEKTRPFAWSYLTKVLSARRNQVFPLLSLNSSIAFLSIRERSWSDRMSPEVPPVRGSNKLYPKEWVFTQKFL